MGLDHKGLEGQEREGRPCSMPREGPVYGVSDLVEMVHVCTVLTSWGCSEQFTCMNTLTPVTDEKTET